MDRNNNDPNNGTHRHQSRIKRELNAGRFNPFNSPPSSTGSHGTVSTTSGELTQDLSNFSVTPDDEGTRKFNEDIKNFNARRSAAAKTRRPTPRPSTINTSALARAFPEWSSLLSNYDIHPTGRSTPKPAARPQPPASIISEGDESNFSYEPRATSTPKPAARPQPPASIIIEEEFKENIPPPSEDTVPVEHLIGHKRPLSRAEMQPRVETISNSSDATVTHPAKSSRRLPKPANAPLSPLFGSPIQPIQTERPSLRDLVSKARPAQATTQKQQSAAVFIKQSPAKTSIKQSPAKASIKQSPAKAPIKQSPLRVSEQISAQQEPHNNIQSSAPIQKGGVTGRSFLLPSFRHLPDLTSGTLKFSTMRDGVPVFVKHGKARTKFGPSANEHDTVEAVNVPEEDKDIFISMDNIREEVRQLQEHDEMVQREAENLQTEIARLQGELKRFKQRKLSASDSAFGSGSESEVSISRALEHQRKLYDEKIMQLQSRLDQASRQVGVHDIHSAALTAERDEALQQASLARERAKKLQSELENSQKDIDTNMGYRQEKETLKVENTSLRASVETLCKQHESVATNYKALTQQNTKLRHDYAALQRELASVCQEMQSLRAQFESVQEEKDMLAEDHGRDNKRLRAKIEDDNLRIADLERDNGSLERNYFRDTESLRAKIEADNQRIADLEKGMARRDQLIEELQANMTTVHTEPAGLREQYAALEDEVLRMRDRQIASQKEMDNVVQIKEDKVRVLMQEVSQLQDQITSTFSLRRENARLQEELKELKFQQAVWQQDRTKNARLSQSEDHLLKDVAQLQHELNEKETKWNEEKSALSREIQRKDAAVKAVKETTRQITDQITLNLNNTNTSAKPAKVTRIVDPPQQAKAKYQASEQSVRSEALNVEDDPTTEVNMNTQESDFLSIFSDDELPKLKQHLSQVQQSQQQEAQQNTEDMSVGNTVQTLDWDLPSLSGPGMRRSKSDSSATQKQKQPASILKKSSQFAQDDTMTGNYSVRSGHSAISRESNQNDNTAQSHISANSFTSNIDRNMTSAFIIPDITLREKTRSTPAQQQTGPALSKEARSVLDGICIHKSQNCTVCSRIHTQSRTAGFATNQKSEANTKKRVRVQKPTPVTERRSSRAEEYVEEPTLRPSMPPGDALAIVIKELNDEIAHLELQIQEKNKSYFALDKSVGQRERKRALAAVQKLQSEYETKSAQVYKLHDVLEGQKAAGQLMSQEELDVTIASICGPAESEATQTQETAKSSARSSTGEWKGFE
jgi:uncharacterized coiled-coil protein SlyX